MKISKKLRITIALIADIIRAFSLVNIVIFMANWIGVVRVHESYVFTSLYDFIMLICFYTLAVAMNLWSLKDE